MSRDAFFIEFKFFQQKSAEDYGILKNLKIIPEIHLQQIIQPATSNYFSPLSHTPNLSIIEDQDHQAFALLVHNLSYVFLFASLASYLHFPIMSHVEQVWSDKKYRGTTRLTI